MCPRSPTQQQRTMQRQLVVSNQRPQQQQQRREKSKKHRIEQPLLTNSITSTQLVVFNHEKHLSSKPKQPPPRQSQQQQKPHLLKGLNIRTEDIRQNYKVLPIIIGTGSFGTVRSCIHRSTRTKLAIKSISTTSSSFKTNVGTLLQNEISILQQTSHPNIIKLIDVMKDGEYIHLIMEQCRGGDLFDLTVNANANNTHQQGGGRLSEGRVRKVVYELLCAVEYMHDGKNIVHRDLKAEHLMFTTSDLNTATIKIIDFGVATIHDHRTDPPLTAFAGSIRSVAPEVIQRSYNRQCDLWSVGIITYFLLTQQMPFNGLTNQDVLSKIVNGRFYYPTWCATGLSEEVKDFIDRLLVVNPRERLSARQALSHVWIRHGGTTNRGRRRRRPSYTNMPVPQQSQSRALVVPRMSIPRMSMPKPSSSSRAMVPHHSQSRRPRQGYYY